MCLLAIDLFVMGCVQGFNSDSEDDHSDDEGDHVEGMSGDEQMGEQEDFEGSDGFDEASCAPSNIAIGMASTQHCTHDVQQHSVMQWCQCMSQVTLNASVNMCSLAHAEHMLALTWHPTVIVVF